MFKHFIITKFNLRTSFWDKTKNDEKVLTIEWQMHRLKIFRDFCFPSVVNQSNQNFIWLVYFDCQSPDFIIEDIKSMKSEYKNFCPKFLEEMELIKTELIFDIREHLDKETKYLISSRLDNDDALNKNYVAEIQSQFNKQSLCLIDPQVGICLQIEPSFLISSYKTEYSPFISLIEKIEGFKTVISKNHNKWKEINSVIKISNSILWLQVIHEKNLLNSVNADKFIFRKKILNEFGINYKKFNPDSLYFIRVFILNLFLSIKKILRIIKKSTWY